MELGSTQPGRDPGSDVPERTGDGESLNVASGQDADGTPAVMPGGPPRRARRTLAQREAAAKLDLAALDAERRRLRTRGMIVAGTLLAGAVRARPALLDEFAAAIRALPERDREAVALFARELA